MATRLEQIMLAGPGNDLDILSFSKATGATSDQVTAWVLGIGVLPRFDGPNGVLTNALRAAIGRGVQMRPTPDAILTFAEAIRKLPDGSQITDQQVEQFALETGNQLAINLSSFSAFKRWLVDKGILPVGVFGGTFGPPATMPTEAPGSSDTPPQPEPPTFSDWVKAHTGILIGVGVAALVFHSTFAPRGRR